MSILNTRLTTTNPTRVFIASDQQAITVIFFCNTSASTVTLNVFAVNNDDSSASSENNTILSLLELTANETYIMSTEKLILDDLDEIEVEAQTANAITVTVSSIAV